MEHKTQNTKHKTQKNRPMRMLHATCYMLHVPAASRQRGMTLVFTVLIVSTILMIALALGIFSFGQMRMIYSAKDSAYAIFGGTSGIERALYGIRIIDDCAGGGTPSYNSILTNESSYDVTVTAGCSPSSATISSNGKYRQTTRKIEASY